MTLKNYFKMNYIVCFILCISGFISQAEVCEIQIKQKVLNLHYPQKTTADRPTVTFNLNGDTLITTFEVISKQINANPTLKVDEYPFMFDVAELFLSVDNPVLEKSDHYPYYEFEISPYGNSFEVLIPGHGKRNINNIQIGAKYEAHIEKFMDNKKNMLFKWTAKIEIPLEKLKWNRKSKSLYGNAYVISGVKPNKNYWSLFLPNMAKPNFHQPKYFSPIFESTCTH